MKRVFISDCEGPISKNDNAFEMTAHFVPSGDKLFTLISRYDDVLAELVKKPGYKAGDTLKLVLPFLKAYGATDLLIREFSANKLILMPFAKVALECVTKIAPAYIISTSYEHYIEALCKSTGFPLKNTYSTKLLLDRYKLRLQERDQLRRLAEEIAAMPIFEVPSRATSLKDFPPRAQATVRKLDEIFWDRIEKMEIGRIFSEVDPIGGIGKAQAIEEITSGLSTNLRDVMYVGDSITDEEAFKLVKEDDGLAVSFNGNQHAIQNAEIALMSPDCTVTAIIAETFLRFGKREALGLVANWRRQTLEKSQVNRDLIKLFFKLHPTELPKAKIITTENRAELSKESTEFRKKVRGEVVGRLG